jgi:hypothetical protein
MEDRVVAPGRRSSWAKKAWRVQTDIDVERFRSHPS